MSSACSGTWGSTGRGGSGAYEQVGDLDPAFDLQASERYADLELIGEGGMGRVYRAYDAKLGRHVALKFVQTTDAGAEARLTREATITAKLEHPGVVPVHDAGRNAQGAPFFAMRLIRGRTLQQVITEGAGETDTEPVSRGRLFRHFLSVCETMAFAHARGVVHLDLKPSNIMVGPFGETQITDWGLAAELPVPARADSHPGTRRYMSPEQQLGEAIDERADVWSLGAILFQIVQGSPPPATGPLGAGSGTTPELEAIYRRALEPRRDHRYPDASELAADLTRWLDGRLVRAYSYSPTELLRRVFWTWRVPLTVATVALTAVAVALSLAYQRTALERDKAQTAQASAERARDAEVAAHGQAREHLASALLGRARDALAAGDRPAAEILAAHVMNGPQRSLALGVLAAFAASPRPERLSHRPLPPSTRLTPSSVDAGFARLHDGELTAHDADGDVEFSLTAGAQSGVRTAPGQLAWVDESRRLWTQRRGEPAQLKLDTFSGSGPLLAMPSGQLLRVSPTELSIYRLADDTYFKFDPCEGEAIVRVAPTPQGVLALCTGGRFQLVSLQDKPTATPFASVPQADLRAFSIATDDAVRIAVVGTTQGSLRIVHNQDAAKSQSTSLRRTAIEQVDVSPDGHHVAALSSRGGVDVYDLRAAAWLEHLPTRHYEHVRWVNNDTLQLLGDALETWSIPAHARPTLLPGEAGIADLDVDRAGRLLAQSRGDGSIQIVDVTTGESKGRYAWQQEVAKSVAFSPDGTQLLAATIGKPHLTLIDLEGGTTRPFPGGNARRVVWLDGGILTFPYSGGPMWFANAGGHPPRDAQGQALAALRAEDAAQADTKAAVFLDVSGEIWWVVPPTAPRHIGSLPEGSVICALGPDRILAARGRELFTLLLDPSGQSQPTSVALVDAEIEDLDYDPRQQLVAVGTQDGSVYLLDAHSFEARWVATAHQNRVSSVAFVNRELLASGSWDGDIRLWSTQVDDKPIDATELEIKWGLTRDEAFRSAALKGM